MFIWIDGQAFQSPSRFRGIGRYILELLKAIKRNHPDVEMAMSFNAAMPNEVMIARGIVKDLIPAKNIHLWEGLRTDGEGVEGHTERLQLSEQLLAFHVASLRPDLAISASPFEGGNNFCVPLTGAYGHDYPIAGIFYDAIPYRYPDLYLANDIAFSYYKRRLFAHGNFDLNLSISDFSNNELIDILEKNNSVPIYAGLSEHFLEQKTKVSNSAALVEALGVNDPYLLYVGELDWRKNYLVIAEALSKCVSKKAKKIKLVIAGGKYQPGIDEMRKRWQESKLNPSNLIFLGHVSDEDLVALYKSAEVLIQPSLMEGFGLTALEGIACNTPVLVANAGALPEVIDCEEALFHPEKPEELSYLIDKLFTDSTFAELLILKSKPSLERYTWDRSSDLAIGAIKNTVETYKKERSAPRSPDQIAIESLAKLKLSKSVIANGLARAILESEKPRSGTLIDVSSTALIDHRTGIQRVVYSISKNLTSNREVSNYSLMSCHSIGRFKKTDLNATGKFKVGSDRKALDLNESERVLMLDGSWDYLEKHWQALMDFYLRGGEIVYVLYDLVPLRAPAYCLEGVPAVYNKWFLAALEIATGFVCISKAVADNLIKVIEGLGCSRSIKVSYWTLGADLIDLSPEKSINLTSAGSTSSASHFLMVGTIEPRKGYDFALQVFSDLWKQGHKFQLTILGKEGWSSEATVKKIESHPQFNKLLNWKRQVTDEEIAQLYAKSDALVSTSHIEGFGLPVVEAAFYKCPAIVPDIAVFRGIANSATTLFYEQADAKSLAETLLSFRKQKSSLSKAFKKTQSTVLTWEASAKQLSEVIEKETWYYHYIPKDTLKNSRQALNLNCETIVHQHQVSFDLLQVSDPIPAADERFYTCTIQVINRGDVTLSSIGPAHNAHLGVFLGIRSIEDDGSLLDYPGNRTKIPSVLIPNLTYYLSVKLKREDYEAGRAFKVQFVQEAHAWYEENVVIQKPRA